MVRDRGVENAPRLKIVSMVRVVASPPMPVLGVPWGRVLRAIREDEITAAASGKDVFRFKLQSFILGAVIMGVGGGLFAYNIRFIDPPTFDPLLATFVIWAMLMVGGSGNNRGAILGAFVVWAIWSWSQFLPGFLADPNFRFLMIGVLIVLAILIRPAGILPERRRMLRSSPTASQTLPRINRVGQRLWHRLRGCVRYRAHAGLSLLSIRWIMAI